MQRWTKKPPTWGAKRKRCATEPQPAINRGREPFQHTAQSLKHIDEERPQALRPLACHLVAGHNAENLAKLRNWNLFADKLLDADSSKEPSQTSASSASDVPNVTSVLTEPVLVKPSCALEHERRQPSHHCQPRSLREKSPPQFLWDFPMPIPLDLRPWRCVECSHSQESQRGQETTYMSPTAADVEAMLPHAYHVHLPRKGSFFITIRFLLQFLTVLNSELNFRQTRRKLLETYMGNVVGVVGRSSRGNLPDAQGILQRFFDPEAFRPKVRNKCFQAVLKSFQRKAIPRDNIITKKRLQLRISCQALAQLAKIAFRDIVARRAMQVRAYQAAFNGSGVRQAAAFTVSIQASYRHDSSTGCYSGRVPNKAILIEVSFSLDRFHVRTTCDVVLGMMVRELAVRIVRNSEVSELTFL